MTSKTRAQLTTEQTTNFADNNTGAITPAILRTTVQDMIDSTGTLLDSNAWSGSAYSFTGSVAVTGVIAANGGIFIASTASLAAGTVSTSSLLIQSTTGSVPGTDQIAIESSNILLKALGSAPATITLGAAGSAYGTLAFAGSTSGTTTIQATAAASGTQTLQAATDTFVYLNTTDTLANKTIAAGGLPFTGSTSGTTTLKPTGAASGTLTLPATSDTLVGKNTTDILTNKTINTGSTSTLQVGSVTLSIGQYPATNTNDSATTGNFGEYVSSSVLVGSAFSISSDTLTNVTSIAVTAGDWDISGVIHYIPGATTSILTVQSSIASTSSTFDTTPERQYKFWQAAAVPGNNTQLSAPIIPSRFSFSASTTVFLVGQTVFTVSTMTVFGMIRARRVR